MLTSTTYHSLHLDIATFNSSRVIYILLPHRLPEEDSMKVVETLMLKGAEVALEVTEGGHDSPVLPRIEKSIVSLLGNQ